MIILGVDCLIEHVKRWFVSWGVDCDSRAGKRMQPIDGRTCYPRVLLHRLRFVSRFGKLRQHNNARTAPNHLCTAPTTAIRKGGTQARTTKRNGGQILRSMVPIGTSLHAVR